MKDAIQNYGRIIIVIIVLLSLIGLIFGGIWLSKIGKTTDEITPDVVPDKLTDRASPTLYLSDLSAIVGRELYVRGLMSATNADGDDISDQIQITSEDGLYNKETGCFLSENAGEYTLVVSVSDPKAADYGLSLTTTKKITVVVNNSLDKYLINTMSVPHGKITVPSQVVRAGTTVKVSAAQDTGYELVGLKIKYQLLKTKEELDADKTSKYKNIEEDVSLDTLCFTMPEADIVIIPEWAPMNVTVLFNANGGTISGDSVFTKKYDSPYGPFPSVSRTGYTLTGWYSSRKGGTQITADTKIATTSTHTIYAQWEKATYTITLNAGEGATLNGENEKTVEYGSRIGKLPTATKQGYTFAGWVLKDDHSVAINARTKYTFDEDITLVPEWVPTSTIIKFDANGGSLSVQSKLVKYGQTYGPLPMPILKGYVFEGWYTDKAAGSLIKSDTQVATSGTQTLYAHWKKAEYTITFNANNGTFDEGAITTLKIHNGDKIDCSKITIPTNGKREFLGWYTGSEGGYRIDSDTVFVYESNITLYAHWATFPIDIKLHYNDNSEIDNFTVKSFNVGARYGAILDIALRDGYILTGWKTNNGDIVNGNSYVEENVTDLYAQWRPLSYDISFIQNPHLEDLNISVIQGTLPTDKLTFATGDNAYNLLKNYQASADNLLFDHWVILDEENEIDVKPETVLNYTHDITVYPAYKDASLIYFNDDEAAQSACSVLNEISPNSAEMVIKNCTLQGTDVQKDYFVVCDKNSSILGQHGDETPYPYKDQNNIIAVYPSAKINAIGNDAFSGCSNLSIFGWHNGINFIGENAFSSTILNNVVVPETTMFLGNGAFASIQPTKISFKTTTPSMQIRTGVLNVEIANFVDVFGAQQTLSEDTEVSILGEKDGKYLVRNINTSGEQQYIGYVETSCVSSISDKNVSTYLDCIPMDCFKDFANLTREAASTLTIPSDIKVIGASAFENYEINSVNFGQDGNSALTYIGASAFNNAIKGNAYLDLTESTLDLAFIGESAFKECTIHYLSFPTVNKLTIESFAFSETDLSANAASASETEYDLPYKPLIIPGNVVMPNSESVFAKTKVGAVVIDDKAMVDNTSKLFSDCTSLQNLKLPCNIVFYDDVSNTNIKILELTRGINGTDENGNTITKQYYSIADVYNDFLGAHPSNPDKPNPKVKIGGYSMFNYVDGSADTTRYPCAGSLKTLIVDEGVFALYPSQFAGCTKLEKLEAPITCNFNNAYYIKQRKEGKVFQGYVEVLDTASNTNEIIEYVWKSNPSFVGTTNLKDVTLTECWYDSEGKKKENITSEDINARPEPLYKAYRNYFNIETDASGSVKQAAFNEVTTHIHDDAKKWYNFDYCVPTDKVSSDEDTRPSNKYLDNYQNMTGNFSDYPWYLSWNGKNAENEEEGNLPKSLTLRDGVVYVPRAMFFNCVSLENITIPASLVCDKGTTVQGKHTTEVGNLAHLNSAVANACEKWEDFDSFGNCFNIEKVVITRGIREGKSTDYADISPKMYLRTSEVGTSSTGLGHNIAPWYDSNKILNIEYADGVKEIGSCSFGNSYDFNTTYATTSDGLLNQALKPSGINTVYSERSFDYKRIKINKLTIPDSVVKINEYAFHFVEWGNDDESSISVPIDLFFDDTQRSAAFVSSDDRVDSIKYGVISSLGETTINEYPADVDSVVCPSKIRHVALTKGLTGVGCNYTAETYKNLPWANPVKDTNNSIASITTTEGVISIGDYMFYNTQAAKNKFTFENSLRSISSSAFEGSSILDIDSKNAKYIGNESVKCLISLDSETLTDYEVSNGTTLILDNAFESAQSLKTIIIPNSVVSLGDNLFFDCDSLSKITINKGTQLTHIGKNLINPENINKNIDYGDLIVDEDYGVFYLKNSGENVYYAIDCYGKQENVVLKDGTILIADNAFEKADVQTLSIPATVKYIGAGALHKIRLVTLNPNNTYYIIKDNTLFTKDESRLVYSFNTSDEYVIPDTVKTIDGYAFADSKIKTLKLHSSITSLGKYSFSKMAMLKELYAPLNLLVDETTFEGTTGITKLHIINSDVLNENVYISISQYQPWNVSGGSLVELYLDAGIRDYSTSFSASRNLTALQKIIILPETTTKMVDMDSKSMACSPWRIYNDKNIKIEDGITYISNSAFAGSKCKEIPLPASIETIGVGAFFNSEITSFTAPSNLKAIGVSAFGLCKQLKSVSLNDGLTCIPNTAFSYTSALTSIVIPKTVTSIEAYAFMGSGISSITLSPGLISIGNDAFESAVNLTSVIIPETVTSIGSSAFANSGITSLTIPNKVTRIEKETFKNCTSLESITIPDSVTYINSTAFDGCPETLTIYGKAGSTAQTFASSKGINFVEQ